MTQSLAATLPSNRLSSSGMTLMNSSSWHWRHHLSHSIPMARRLLTSTSLTLDNCQHPRKWARAPLSHLGRLSLFARRFSRTITCNPSEEDRSNRNSSRRSLHSHPTSSYPAPDQMRQKYQWTHQSDPRRESSALYHLDYWPFATRRSSCCRADIAYCCFCCE